MRGVTPLFPYYKTMESSTSGTLNFRGDDAVLNINQFYRNFAGFLFTKSRKIAASLMYRYNVLPVFSKSYKAREIYNDEFGEYTFCTEYSVF